MNASDPGTNVTSPSPTEAFGLPPLTPAAPPGPVASDSHDPEFTILVVLGLSLLLAGVAAFLAVCRSTAREGGAEEETWGQGERLARGRAASSEPQLKVWRRLGSYRRSYNISFRRPQQQQQQQRRAAERHCSRPAPGPPRPSPTQTLPGQGATEPQITMPCLIDYVTEI